MKNIKNILALLILQAILFAGFGNAAAKTDADESASAGLDLHAVGELFKEAENPEHFEQTLNQPDTGINNLDLDANGEVDYIRVEEHVDGDTHMFVLQAPFSDTEVQDVATILIEKEDEDKFNMQLQGAPEIYGADYYIVPAAAGIGAWRTVRWIYLPAYRPYRSIFGWRVYPRWWRVRRPVAINVYRTRTAVYAGRRNFAASNAVRVKTAGKINYRPRTATVVRKKKVVVTNGNRTVVTKGVRKTNKNGTTAVKGVRKTGKNGTKTKVKVKRTRN